MNHRLIRSALAIVGILFVAVAARAERVETPLVDPQTAMLAEAKIEQRLNASLPLDAEFFDEKGQTVKLGNYFHQRPVVLAFVYYQCPSLCNEVLNGMVTALRGLDFNAGKEFDVVVISFEPKEGPDLAAAKKKAYLLRYARKNTEHGWHFLTGKQESIEQVTKAAGFHYRWDDRSKQYAHSSGIMVATPDGRMSRYFFGVDFSTRDLRLGLVESSQNKIGTVVDAFQLLCFHYDPMTGKYGLAIHRLILSAGFLTVGALGTFITTSLLRERKQRSQTQPDSVSPVEVN